MKGYFSYMKSNFHIWMRPEWESGGISLFSLIEVNSLRDPQGNYVKLWLTMLQPCLLTKCLNLVCNIVVNIVFQELLWHAMFGHHSLKPMLGEHVNLLPRAGQRPSLYFPKIQKILLESSTCQTTMLGNPVDMFCRVGARERNYVFNIVWT